MKFKKTSITSAIILMVSFLLTSAAMAGFNITRMTTVVDDLSGSYTVTKSGRLEEGDFTGTALTEFNNFHPGMAENEATLTGVIAKTVVRSVGFKSTIADGDFILQRDETSLAIGFEDLSVSIDEGEVALIGKITVNEESMDINDLPEAVAAVLRRVFWLTRR